MNDIAIRSPDGFRIRHTMLRVRDLDRSIDFYTRLLGMGVMRRRPNADPDGVVAYLGYGEEDGNHALELLEDADNSEAYDSGTGYGHIALAVPDIYALSEMLEKEGVDFILAPEPIRPGSPNIVAFIRDPDGYEIELTERH